MAFESLNKIAPALFSPEQDLIEVYNKKTGTVGVINPSYIKSSPSGSAGAIQFSDGSAFSSDSNLFWDDTNNRLGVGTNAPNAATTINTNGAWAQGFSNNLRLNAESPSLQLKTTAGNSGFMIGTSGPDTIFASSTASDFSTLTYNAVLNSGNWGFGGYFSPSARMHIKGSGTTSATSPLLVQNSGATDLFRVRDDGSSTLLGVMTAGTLVSQGNIFFQNILYSNNFWSQANGDTYIGFQGAPSAKLQIKGNGSTSATTSLLVQNSSGSSALTVKDDLSVLISAGGIFGFGDTTNYAKKSGAIDGVEIAGYGGVGLGAFGGINTFVVHSGSASLGATTANASAIFDITSTTKGFLPPRMTTTQINAIASPAEGLVAYNTTISHLCVYQSGAWVKLNHSPM